MGIVSFSDVLMSASSERAGKYPEIGDTGQRMGNTETTKVVWILKINVKRVYDQGNQGTETDYEKEIHESFCDQYSLPPTSIELAEIKS